MPIDSKNELDQLTFTIKELNDLKFMNMDVSLTYLENEKLKKEILRNNNENELEDDVYVKNQEDIINNLRIILDESE